MDSFRKLSNGPGRIECGARSMCLNAGAHVNLPLWPKMLKSLHEALDA